MAGQQQQQQEKDADMCKGREVVISRIGRTGEEKV